MFWNPPISLGHLGRSPQIPQPPHTLEATLEMARGNQRDKAREATQKKLAAQKSHNTMSGAEMQREKEKVAQKMREKQAAADAKKSRGGLI